VRQSPWGPGKAPGNDSGRIPGSPCDILGQAACGGGFGVQRRSLPIRAGEPLEAANLETRPHVPQSRYEAGDRSGKGAAALGADGDVGGIVVEIETADLRAGLEIPENQVPQGVVGNALRACQCRAAVRADGRGPDVGHVPLEAADLLTGCQIPQDQARLPRIAIDILGTDHRRLFNIIPRLLLHRLRSVDDCGPTRRWNPKHHRGRESCPERRCWSAARS
jgi:hypothetical protein